MPAAAVETYKNHTSRVRYRPSVGFSRSTSDGSAATRLSHSRRVHKGETSLPARCPTCRLLTPVLARRAARAYYRFVWAIFFLFRKTAEKNLRGRFDGHFTHSVYRRAKDDARARARALTGDGGGCGGGGHNRWPRERPVKPSHTHARSAHGTQR